ncbi:MAG: DUF3237 domain-containing protein [Stellaceae bacterium]
MVQVPGLEFVFAALVKVAPPVEFGETPQGRRRMIPILGGIVEGPSFRGEVLAGGADWQLLRPDGASELVAQYAIRADDGAIIAVTNRGLRHAPPEVMARLNAGEPVDPEAVYFRASPSFSTAATQHAWLNRHLFLCIGGRAPDAVQLDFFRVM